MLKLVASFVALVALALSQECMVNTDFESTCNIGGLILTKDDQQIKVTDDNCDSIYKKEQFATSPNVTFPKALQGQTYTIVCIDPDAPFHPKGQYYLHWIRANILGEDLAKGDISKGVNLIDYIGPGPPIGTGLHRYMFLAFRHVDPALRFRTTLTQQSRKRFDLADWIATVQGKEGAICGPEGAIQFRSQFA